jgi:hypothetical protein
LGFFTKEHVLDEAVLEVYSSDDGDTLSERRVRDFVVLGFEEIDKM